MHGKIKKKLIMQIDHIKHIIQKLISFPLHPAYKC